MKSFVLGLVLMAFMAGLALPALASEPKGQCIAEMPDPAQHRPGTPERILADFLLAWHQREWKAMAQNSTYSFNWNYRKWPPTKLLRARLEHLTLARAIILRLKRQLPLHAFYDVEICYTFISKGETNAHAL